MAYEKKVNLLMMTLIENTAKVLIAIGLLAAVLVTYQQD
jgi:hypothetical protein